MTAGDVVRFLRQIEAVVQAVGAGFHWDLLVAAASAGVLIYSARLLVPAARLHPEDIIARYPSGLGEPYALGAGDVPWPVFPEDDIRLDIRSDLDAKAGFVLLIFGTIGGVFATIVDAFTRTWNVPSGPNLVLAAAAGALGYGGGRWWAERSGWHGRQERALLVHCFLLWLEREVGDPQAKGEEFALAVVSTARTSGFSLLGNLLVPLGAVRTETDDKAAARRIVGLAREHDYRWRRLDFRKWADDVARGTPNTTAKAK